MTLVMVERSFEKPTDPEALNAREAAGKWCLDLHRVRFVRTHVARDGKRMLCVYEAPDAEAVRISQRTIEMPVDRVWAAHALRDVACTDGVIVERILEPALTAEQVRGLKDQTEWCLDAYRVRWQTSYLALDGGRMVCLFEAPDVESVRMANRKAGLPEGRVYAARSIDAASPP